MKQFLHDVLQLGVTLLITAEVLLILVALYAGALR